MEYQAHAGEACLDDMNPDPDPNVDTQSNPYGQFTCSNSNGYCEDQWFEPAGGFDISRCRYRYVFQYIKNCALYKDGQLVKTGSVGTYFQQKPLSYTYPYTLKNAKVSVIQTYFDMGGVSCVIDYEYEE